jgi:transcriptional regulator with XRE-family HTH domain
MGYFGKIEEKALALKLRRRGLSYSEIQKLVKVSKDTLSRWCRDIILSPEQIERLRKRKLKGSERGRIIGAKKLQEKRLREIELLNLSGRKDIGDLSKRDRFLIGVSLYAAEGVKSDHNVEFSNSDPRMISFMMKWFREFCDISEDRFRGAIWIHDNLDKHKAVKYWSKLTKIPVNQFHKTYVVRNKENSRKVRKKRNEFGVFSIRVSSAKTQRKIMGWVSGILSS